MMKVPQDQLSNPVIPLLPPCDSRYRRHKCFLVAGGTAKIHKKYCNKVRNAVN
jgi:hypothetical protein